jgi:hypothetical protein
MGENSAISKVTKVLKETVFLNLSLQTKFKLENEKANAR